MDKNRDFNVYYISSDDENCIILTVLFFTTKDCTNMTS